MQVGDFLLSVNGADVSKLRPDDLIRVLQSTKPPRSFKFLRLGRGPAGPGDKGPGPAPPSNAIVFTVQVTTPAIGLRLGQTRLGFMVQGFTPGEGIMCTSLLCVEYGW